MHVKNLAFCVWEWRRSTIQYNTIFASKPVVSMWCTCFCWHLLCA